MEFEPARIVFPSVRLNQSYSSSLCISNPLSASVEFTIRPSSSRYTVTPDKVRLSAGQTIVVTVKLFLNHYPSSSKASGGHEDSLHVKSVYFDQKIPVEFFVHTQQSSSRSPSPNTRLNDLSYNSDSNNVNRSSSSRNSPNHRKVSSLVEELQAQLRSKDDRINELRAIVGNLESKYPNIHEVVRARVEEERNSFEEKSEKILKILKRKDDAIASLQLQLEEEKKRADIEHLMNSSGRNSSGLRDRDNWEDSGAADEVNRRLKLDLEEALTRLQKEQLAHSQTRDELNQMKMDAIDMESRMASLGTARERSTNNTFTDRSGFDPQQMKELRGLREKTIDQAEQIEVLVSELSKVRESEQSNDHNKEMLKLAKHEIEQLRQQVKEKEQTNSDLHRKCTQLQQDLAGNQELLQQSQQQSRFSQSADRNNIAASLATNGRIYEPMVGGGVGTATPQYFGSVAHRDLEQALQEKSAQAALYKEKYEDKESELSDFKMKLSASESVERDLRQKAMELERRVQSSEKENKVLFQRIERVKSEKEEVELRLQEQDQEVQHTRQRLNQHKDSSQENDSHAWWIYVWHEVKKQGGMLKDLQFQFDSQISGGIADRLRSSLQSGTGSVEMPGDFNYEVLSESGAAAHIAKLRENIRSQALEIATARQESLARKLTGKREVDQLKEQLAFANREILRLKSKNRIARGDKDIKISEMAATIRSLSARSDMHAQLIQTKQEMEAERLANAHLRADLDTVKEMLEEEQRKCQMCRSEVSALQGMVDSVAVFQTVLNVPGVQPATLIELMSGQIVMLSSEVSKLKKNLNEAVEQSKSLQRTMQLKSNRQDDPSPFADTLRSSRSIPPSRGRARSLSPMKQSVATSPYKSTSGNASPQRLRASTSSLPLLFTEERQSPVLALDNPNFRLENYESTESHSKARLHDNLFSIVVDKEATPKMVLESLDAAILAQKVQTHENTIIELQEQIDKLTDEALQTERVRLFERDDMEAADRIELQSCAQRLELVQTQLSEAKQEAADLCEKNLGLEKTIVDMQSRILYDDPKDSTSPHYDAAESNSELESMLFDTRTRDHTSEMDIRNQDNGSSSVKLELDNTKSLLRERTAQLKIVMETLDTLQMAGVNAHDLRERGLEGLADIAASSLPTVEGSWGLQALVKRVVDLTTELSSQSALAALEERRAADLDSENRKRVKELSSLRSIAKSEEEKCAKLQIQIAALREQVTVNEKRNLDLVSSQRIENEELITAVRDAEAKVRNYEIQINDLKKQIQMTDQQDFQQWLEVITLENQKLVETPIDQLLLPSKDPLTQSSEDIFNGKTVSSSPVRDLVVGLISQWKEFVGNYTVRNPIGVTGSAARNTTTSVSKAEQRFMQRVVDLVMQANDRALTASKKAKDFEAMVKRSEMATTISSERLKFCAQQLNRYRRRCQAYEKVLHNNSNEAVIKQGKLESILRKSVASERRSYAEVYNQLRCERRDRIILEMKRAAQVLQNRKMQVRVAELEARGSAQLRGRDEAISGLEAKLKLAEDAMYSWFKVELPRLVLGMPVTEDSLAGFYSEQLHDDHLPIGSQLAASMGLDKTFALSQALCSAKATQTAQQMRITGLMEKLSILKERNLELEGVVMRWKTNILNSAGSRDTFDADCLPSIRTEDLDNLIQRIYSYSAAEAKTNEKIQVLSNRAMELEEENIETRGRLEQAEHRSEEMKQLVEVVISEEQALKAKATQQLTKIRIDLENEHAEELHRIRKAYEDERNALVTELENVALAVEEAKMTTKVDVHGPTSLIMSAKQSMFDDIKPIYSDQSSGHDSSISREQQKSKRIKPKKGSSERKRRSTSSSDSDSDGSSGDDDYRQSQLVVPGNSVRKENRPRREKGSNNSKADSFHDTQSMASSITSGQLFAVTGTASANKSIAGHGDPLSPVREDDRESAISSSSSPPSDKGSNASSEKSLKDVEVGSLQRILEIERRKHAEARYEVEELTNLLAIQQDAFKQHLDSKAASSITNPDTVATADGSGVESNSKEALLENRPKVNLVEELEHELRKEDQSLWPSVRNILDEQLHLLNSLAAASSVRDTDSFISAVRTVMAMATRVKVILESKHFDAVPTREVSDRNSSDNSAQTHRHTEDDGGFAAPFSSLLNRVKLMESDFSDDNIPERHLYLLRDIRVRVTELEKAVTREYTQKKENWESEKRSLLQQLREKTSLAEEIKIAQEEGFKKLRKRYEDALSAAEEALATNTTAAKHEVERLEELLHKNTRDSSESVGSHRNKDDKSSVLTNNTMTEYVKLQQLLDKATDELESSKEKLRTVENQRANEINTLRTHFARFRRAQAEVVQSLEDQLEDMRSQSITVGGSSSALDSYQSLVSGTVSSIAEAEDKLRRLAYRYHMKSVELDAVMRSLTQIADVSDEVENSQGFSQDNSTLEFPEIFTRHSAPPPANYFNNKEGIASRDDRRKNFVAPDSPGQQSQNTSFRSNRDVVEEIYEARILATEKEVEALHNNLSRERRINHELRAELERYVRSSDHAGAFGSGPTMKHAVKERVSAIAGPSRNNIGDKAEFPNVGLEGQDHDQKLSSTGDAGTIESVLAALANSRSVLAQTEQFMSDTAQEYAFTETDVNTKEKTRNILRRMNELRRLARKEITRLKDHISSIQENASKAADDIAKLKGSQSDLKLQLQHLKEDNLRKTKLIASIKAAKNADSNALEQWKAEGKNMEENIKRMQRSIASKDAMIKDLKAKLDTMGELTDRSGIGPGGAPSTSNIDNFAGLSVQELKNRLKASELERARVRSRLQALKEKITELENIIKDMSDENEKLRKTGEKVEMFKSSITRKDTLINSLKAQINRLTAEYDILKASENNQQTDAEKKIRALQRQVDTALRNQSELEKESQLMRRRLSESSELVNFSNAQRRQESLDRAIERTALANRNRTGVSFAPEVKTSNRFDDESNNFDDSREQWQQDLPAALSSSANDLGDVMSALGVRSQPSISTGNNNSILTSSSVSSGDAEMTSVEKRLKALVNTALQSPLRR